MRRGKPGASSRPRARSPFGVFACWWGSSKPSGGRVGWGQSLGDLEPMVGGLGRPTGAMAGFIKASEGLR